jgi:hypothetical protein
VVYVSNSATPLSLSTSTFLSVPYSTAPVRTNISSTRSTFEKAAEQLQNQSRILETLFPGVDLADLLGKSQSELLDLISGKATSSQPRASTTSTTVSAIAPANVHGASPDDGSFVHQPPRETEDSTAVSDNGDPPAERRYDEPMDGQQGSVASDDINAMGLAIDHRIRSYLGMTSMSAIIRAIFRLCPAAKEHTAQCAKSWSSLPSQCLPSMPFLERDPAMDGLREQRCIDFYFDNVHAITPLLDEDEFRAQYQAGTRQDDSWKGLLYMVFTLGSIASGSDSLHEHYYRHARSFVTLDNLGCGNIESLQALCLLGGYYLHYRNSPNMAYSVLGAAHRVAIALGLHREPRHRPARASSAGPGSGADANEAELSRRRVETRRKTWWSLFCLDTWGAMTQGRPTCGRWDSTTMDTQFPVASSPDDYCIESLVASARFCLICDRMQQCFARFGRLTTQEIIDYDAELVRWYEGLPPSITDPSQSPLRFTIAREFMRTRYLNARMLLTRSSFLYIASGSSRRGIADLAPEPRQLLETCCSVASETVDAIALYWTPNRVHVWNAGWYLFQACMTPLLSLAVDRNMSAGSAASKDSVAAWRACLAKALETFYEMRPWMRPSDRSPDIVSAMYEALISDYDGQLSTPSGTGASLDMAGWYDDHMNDLDWSIVLGGEPLSFQGIFSTP